MSWYYLYEVAITGIFDDLFIGFCIAVFYYLNKYDRWRTWQDYKDK
tara:strand:- start:335 stop:472 length:138 start_codon:yes stop_codon:yes gene_type:complete